MTTILSRPPSSRLSNFFHDLVTVDFHQTLPLSLGVRLVVILIIIMVVGLITGHSAEASFVYIGATFVLVVDQLRSKGPRTRVLLGVSILYASIFAIGMVISISENLAIPLCGLGLFIISYLAVYTKAFWTLFYASIIFVIAITFQGATPAMAGQNFVLIFVGGLWAIVGGIIFLPRKTSKQQHTVTTDPIQEQPQSKLTWQDKLRPLTSNLSIHSHHFQYAILFAITGVVSMLIIQWFKLSAGDWVLISVVNILAPGFSDVSLSLRKVVHRIIGTIIGAIIASIIIGSVHNIWLLSLLFFIFSIATVLFAKQKNYAFFVIFMTVQILLFVEISFPTFTGQPLERVQNIFIGCVLALVASSIWIAFRRKKSNLPLADKGE